MAFMWAVPTLAGDAVVIKQDYLHSDRYQITEATGHSIGTVKSDPISSNRMQITDRAGNRKGYIQPSPLYPSDSHQNIHGNDCQRIGTIKPDPLTKASIIV